MRECENCKYLGSEGYEYPEYYCLAGISEDDEHYKDGGCNYHWKTLKKKYDELQEDMSSCYYIPLCRDCLYYPKCRDFEETTAKAYFLNYVCDDFKEASNYIELKSCNGCFWKGKQSYHCRYCRRNRKLKDKYSEMR